MSNATINVGDLVKVVFGYREGEILKVTYIIPGFYWCVPKDGNGTHYTKEQLRVVKKEGKR